MNKFIFSLALFTFIISCSKINNIYFDPNKSHHTKVGFVNPYMKSTGKKSLIDLYKMFSEPRPKVNDKYVELENIDIGYIKKLIVQKKNFFIWIGHSTLLLNIGGKLILTDPIFSQRCSPAQFMGPKRYTQPALSISNLPPIDIIFISHNHYDHLDYNSVIELGNQPLWIVPLGIKKWFIKNGINNVREYDWWEEDYIDGYKIVCLPSQHWSKRSLFDSMETLWASWLIEIDGFKFWFAGDTGYNNVQFNQIGEKYGPINFSAIPIGAYEPRWFMKNAHINPHEAVLIHNEVRSEISFGIHWGTFILTTESIDEPPLLLDKAKKKMNISEEKFIISNLGKVNLLYKEN